MKVQTKSPDILTRAAEARRSSFDGICHHKGSTVSVPSEVKKENSIESNTVKSPDISTRAAQARRVSAAKICHHETSSVSLTPEFKDPNLETRKVHDAYLLNRVASQKVTLDAENPMHKEVASPPQVHTEPKENIEDFYPQGEKLMEVPLETNQIKKTPVNALSITKGSSENEKNSWIKTLCKCLVNLI
jgi:hypothetical protein